MSVTHRSLSVAVESTFGSPDSNGIPSVSGLTTDFVSIPCERDPVVLSGDPVVSERNDTRDGAYFNAPEPDTVWSGGSRVRRRTGSITCRVDLTTIGTSAANYNSNYLGYLLGAGFNTQAPSANLKADSASAVVDENTYTPTNAPAVSDVGLLIGTEINGRAEYSAITDNDVAGDVTVSPAFSDGFSGTPTLRGLQTWYVPSRTNSGEFNHSLAFKIDGANFQQIAYGCVLESMNITLDSGRLMAELTYQAAFITDNHSGAIGSVEPAYNSGSPAFFRGSYVVVSDGSPASSSNGTAGETLDRLALDCEDFSLTVTNTLTPLSYSNDVIGMSGMDISDVSVELSLTLSTVNTTVANDYFNRTVRQVLVGTGPIDDGKGCAIMLPAAVLTNDPSVYDVSGNDIVRQTLTYQQARYAGDFTTSSYEANAGNSPFRIGLTVGNV